MRGHHFMELGRWQRGYTQGYLVKSKRVRRRLTTDGLGGNLSEAAQVY